jgi:hypothetical protein
VSLRIGIAALLAEIVRQRTIQIDNFVALPRADAALWTENNDLHAYPPVFNLNLLLALQIPHL